MKPERKWPKSLTKTGQKCFCSPFPSSYLAVYNAVCETKKVTVCYLMRKQLQSLEIHWNSGHSWKVSRRLDSSCSVHLTARSPLIPPCGRCNFSYRPKLDWLEAWKQFTIPVEQKLGRVPRGDTSLNPPKWSLKGRSQLAPPPPLAAGMLKCFCQSRSVSLGERQ